MQRHAQTASGGTACACACVHVCTRLCQPPPGCRLPALRPVPFPPGATAVASQGSPVQDGRSGRLVPRQLLGSRPIRTKAQEGAGAVSQKETNSAGGGAALSRPLLPPAAPNPWTCAPRLPRWRSPGLRAALAVTAGPRPCGAGPPPAAESSSSGPLRTAFLGHSVHASRRPLRWVHAASRRPPQCHVAGREGAE